MLSILTRSPFRKLHPAAFSGSAICPSCFGSKVKLLEWVGPHTSRWQCKACYQTFREDMAPRGFYGDDPKTREVGNSPYRTLRGVEDKFRQDQKRRQLEKLKKETGFAPDMKIGVHKFKK